MLAEISTLRLKRDILIESYDDRIDHLKTTLKEEMEAACKLKITGETMMAYIRTNTEVKVNDWEALQAYVVKHNAFDMLQRRVSPAAIAARLEAGETIACVSVEKSEGLIIKSIPQKKE